MTAPAWLIERPIAHRGLHDLAAGRPENSLAACKAAAERDYAIECDLQPSRDNVPMVFHDPVLPRLTGAEGNMRDRDATDLAPLKLLGTEETVPTLAELLGVVKGRVPIVLELKGPQPDADAFVASVADAIRNHAGPIALMSFDHDIVRAFAKHAPDRPRGLTAGGEDETFDKHMRIFDEADLQFVSYHVDALPNRFVRAVRERGVPVITWTVRSPEQVARTRRYADQMTFEGFLPDG